MLKKTLTFLSPTLIIGCLILAVQALHKELKVYTLHDIVSNVALIPKNNMLIAILLSVCSYIILTGYDYIGLRYLAKNIKYKYIAFTSFISYAFSLNIGMSIFSGGTIRYRLYSLRGLSPSEIARLISFCVITFWIGYFATAGIIFTISPVKIPGLANLPITTVRPIGLLLLSIVVGYLLLIASKINEIKIKNFSFALPSINIAIGQILIGIFDFTVVPLIFFTLLPHTPQLSLLTFISLFLFAQISGMVSNVPGGLGVFDTLIILLLKPYIPASSVLGTILVYRGIYFLIPFIISIILGGVFELKQNQKLIKINNQAFWGIVTAILSILLAIAYCILVFKAIK